MINSLKKWVADTALTLYEMYHLSHYARALLLLALVMAYVHLFDCHLGSATGA